MNALGGLARLRILVVSAGAVLVAGLSFGVGAASAVQVGRGVLPPCKELVGPPAPICSGCVDGAPLGPCKCIQPEVNPPNPPDPKYCDPTPPTSLCAKSWGVQNSQTTNIVVQNQTTCYRTYQCKAQDPDEPCDDNTNPCLQTQTGGGGGSVYELAQINVGSGECEPGSPR